MIDLEKTSGLPISIDKNYQLVFRDPLSEVKPSLRRFSDMIPVLMDKDAKPNPEIDEMYYMYRDVHLSEDEDTIRTNNIRYDITVIPPAKIGKEFTKTVGHYHPNDPKGFAYPEVYEVLHGEAIFLIQKTDATYKVAQSVIYIKATTGEKVIYPPLYGHIIVNIGSNVLVTANWVADKFDSLYQPIVDSKGMAYYVVADSNKRFAFVQNPNYDSHPPVREIVPSRFIEQFPIAKNEPMYKTAIKNPQTVEFLNIPDKYTSEFAKLTP